MKKLCGTTANSNNGAGNNWQTSREMVVLANQAVIRLVTKVFSTSFIHT